MVHYHKTGQGLSCFTFSDDTPIHIRCKGRVAVASPHSGTAGSRRRLRRGRDRLQPARVRGGRGLRDLGDASAAAHVPRYRRRVVLYRRPCAGSRVRVRHRQHPRTAGRARADNAARAGLQARPAARRLLLRVRLAEQRRRHDRDVRRGRRARQHPASADRRSVLLALRRGRLPRRTRLPAVTREGHRDPERVPELGPGHAVERATRSHARTELARAGRGRGGQHAAQRQRQRRRQRSRDRLLLAELHVRRHVRSREVQRLGAVRLRAARDGGLLFTQQLGRSLQPQRADQRHEPTGARPPRPARVLGSAKGL